MPIDLSFSELGLDILELGILGYFDYGQIIITWYSDENHGWYRLVKYDEN